MNPTDLPAATARPAAPVLPVPRAGTADDAPGPLPSPGARPHRVRPPQQYWDVTGACWRSCDQPVPADAG